MTDDQAAKTQSGGEVAFTPSIRIDSQECVAGRLIIEAGHAADQGVVTLAVERAGNIATVYLTERHIRELATTLLAIASRLEEEGGEQDAH